MKSIQQVRKELGLTQVEAAKALNISRRKLQNYEAMKDEEAQENRIFNDILKKLEDYWIDEEHGFVTFRQIKHANNRLYKFFFSDANEFQPKVFFQGK